MIDMTQTVIPRSDQKNADDLISGPTTIKVTRVTLTSSEQQPINIDYEGGEGKPYKPCKSMRRILILGWGKDGSAYVGKSMTLYRDPTVKYGGAEQGGIRISHMSHLADRIRTALTVTKGKRTPFTVEVLKDETTAGPALSADDAKLWKSEIDRCTNMAGLSDVTAKIASNKYADSDIKADLMKHYRSAVTAIREEDAAPDNPANMDFPADTDTDKEG